MASPSHRPAPPAADPAPAPPCPEALETQAFLRSLGTAPPVQLRMGVTFFPGAPPEGATYALAPFQVRCKYYCYAVEDSPTERARQNSAARRRTTARDLSSSSGSDTEPDSDHEHVATPVHPLFPSAIGLPLLAVELSQLRLVEKFDTSPLLTVGRGNLVEGLNIALQSMCVGQRAVFYVPPVAAHYDSVAQFELKYKQALVFDVLVSSMMPGVAIGPHTFKFSMNTVEASMPKATVGSAASGIERETDVVTGVSQKPRPFKTNALALDEVLSDFATGALISMSQTESATVINFMTGEETVLTLSQVDNTLINKVFDDPRVPTRCLLATPQRLEWIATKRDEGRRLVEGGRFIKAEFAYRQALAAAAVQPPLAPAAFPAGESLAKLQAVLWQNIAVTRSKRDDHEGTMTACHQALCHARECDKTDLQSKPLFMLAKSLRILNNLPEARKYMDALLALFPSRADALRSSADIANEDRLLDTALAAAAAAQV